MFEAAVPAFTQKPEMTVLSMLWKLSLKRLSAGKILINYTYFEGIPKMFLIPCKHFRVDFRQTEICCLFF